MKKLTKKQKKAFCEVTKNISENHIHTYLVRLSMHMPLFPNQIEFLKKRKRLGYDVPDFVFEDFGEK